MEAKDLMVKKKDYNIEGTANNTLNSLMNKYNNTNVVNMVLSLALEKLSSMNIIGENWKDVPDYEGLYLISNKGRVKSVPRVMHKGTKFAYSSKEKILKTTISKDGYVYVSLCKNGKMKQKAIHRLVAIAFIPNNGLLSDVNHKDENKLNNCVENLEWCSKEYNTKYGTRTERTSKPILQYTKDGVFIRRFASVKEASRITKIGSSNISNCAKNKVLTKDGKQYRCQSAGGYIWKYE